MYLDKETEFSDSQAVTAAAASTNYMNLGAARDIGVGKQKYVLITCKEAATAAGAATVNFQLQTDDNSAFSSPKTVYDSGSVGKAALIVGYQLFIPIPLGTEEQYLRLYYNVGTGPLTAGKFSASIVESPQIAKLYAAS